ncbi:MAG: hypothetical protein OXC44_07985 [Proteobacteria bacterium]|nr:hypothetical protein [Pseudomonadota bacterium]
MTEAFNIPDTYEEWKSSKKQNLLEQQISDASKERILSKIKEIRPFIKHAQYKKSNEANTVKIVQDICVDLLGYHKHYEIEMEYFISGKRCDMAILVDKKLKFLIEIKAIRIHNIHKYIDQSLQYGIDSRTHCVVLTNARIWYIYWLNHENPSIVNYRPLFVLDILNDRPSKTAKCFQNLAKEHITQFIKDGIAQDKAGIGIEETSRPNRFMSIFMYIGLAIVLIIAVIKLIPIFISIISLIFSITILYVLFTAMK